MLENELIYFVVLAATLIVIALINSKNIVVVAILNGSFSLFTVLLYLILDAPDVAMTEASIGVLVFILAVFTIKANYKESHLFEDRFKPIIFIACSLMAAGLIYASADLPEFGSPKFNNYYLLNSGKEIGINSVVASILGSYRGYDTMLETLVILIGGIGVLLISQANMSVDNHSDKLITLMSRIMFPVISLFALYIQFNGENTPGGGFQAGAIMATIFATYGLANGKLLFLELVSLNALKIIAISGVILFFSVGLLSFIMGGEFLNYNVTFGQHIGITIIELGVGIAVCATMLMIYIGISDASDKSL